MSMYEMFVFEKQKGGQSDDISSIEHVSIKKIS